jgi:hypothetical protein
MLLLSRAACRRCQLALCRRRDNAWLRCRLEWLGCRGWQRRPLADVARGGLLSHAPAVLHDMAACIAEAVAVVYLAEVRAPFPAMTGFLW